MPMYTVDEFKRHGSCAVNRVHVSTRGAEPAVASERDEFKITTFGTAIHCATKRGITTVYHLVHVFNDGITRMSEKYKFFIMIFKDILKDI